ncbi:helix-turn-helix domain-containing protein [Psychrobacillus sp. L3]|uniref:helix-turn-helix domain-containing protein n=1 Tax=Psychrobacillus sp. L3 TaxID=3236891 RepID=UPI0036F24C08
MVDSVAYHVPADFGFPARYNWTRALIAEYIQIEWDKTYTIRGVSGLLHKLGFSHTRQRRNRPDFL